MIGYCHRFKYDARWNEREGEIYTYNIYVYSESNPNTTYTYVDPWTGLSFKSDKVTVGSEKVGNYVPAHVGNTIDWTNKLYTETNVPTGYVYVQVVCYHRLCHSQQRQKSRML